MLAGIVAWLKGLSVVGKVTMGVAAAGAVGALAVSGGAPEEASTSSVIVQEPAITYETVETTEVIEHGYKEKETSALTLGSSEIETEGVDGEETSYYIVKYSDGMEVSREFERKAVTKEPTTEIKLVGTYVAPQPAPAPAASRASNCDPNYAGGCVPVVSYDLNCPDIGFMVQVVGTDVHRFDRDRDGWGCESYR